MDKPQYTADAAKEPLRTLIGAPEIESATQTLQRYKQGKAHLEARIIANEKWYRIRHWDLVEGAGGSQIKPASAWLFNFIANKHADVMDNFPAPNILPREEGDKAEAKILSNIIPVILDQAEFEDTYSSVMQYKLKNGTGVYGVFWDASLHSGLGDIAIRKVDIINLFWESGITDIQKSQNVFHVELVDNASLEAKYPSLQGKLATSTIEVSKYVHDDTVDTSDKSAVVDWYYKRTRGTKTVLHYCKFVNNTVLFATENDPKYAERGWYDHGQYPFVFDVLYPVEGTPCGFGYIDVGKNAQEYIDRGNQAVIKNMLANAAPRYFIRSDGSVNEAEYADITRDFIHVDGNLGQDSILPITPNPLNSIYLEIINSKIEELKETTGNRDVSTGGTTSGVTAASAIAAMQEAGSKLSRDLNKASYRAYKKVIYLVIELIRQFYELPRTFRIIGERGTDEYVRYSNKGITPQSQDSAFGVDLGYRLPLFDIEVTAQKASPYSKMSQNELALQFFRSGFFNPALADQALACIDMMDFDRKDFVAQKISENGTLYQQLMQMQQTAVAMAQLVDNSRGTSYAQQILSGEGTAMPIPEAAPRAESTDALGGESVGESPTTKKARERTAQSTEPR